MYSTKSGLILGFHGCDEHIGRDIVLQNIPFKSSTNKYDWLGEGMYFWENSPSRAEEFIDNLHKNPQKGKEPIKKPFVIGAVIDLGHCLDLTDYYSLQTLKIAYEYYKILEKESGWKLVENTNPPSLKSSKFKFWRQLDCAVINLLHKSRKEQGLQSYDSVRGLFMEGDELYPTAGFRDKNHIQLSILNPNCIKGFFIPRNKI